MTDDGDPVLARLRELPVERLDDVTVERVRRAARAVLKAEGSGFARFWRACAALAVAATIAAYLGWAVTASAALY